MITKEGKKIRVGVVTPPISAAGLIPLSNLLNILSLQSETLYLITGNAGNNYFKNDVRIISSEIVYHKRKNKLLRIFTFFYLQIRIALVLIKIVKRCDVWVFFLGGEIMVLPMFIAKLFRKKVFLLFGGSAVNIYFFDNSAIHWLKILTTINCSLSDKLILYSKNLVKDWKLEKYENKIEFAHEHIIDFQKFKIIKQHRERENIIGFIGRLSEEKGILNFVKAIDIIIKDRKNITFLIIGDGQLRKKIEHYIDQKKLNSYVKIEGWVSHHELPLCFNKLKLMVIPSYTEGLPNAMLEAMACGTPVLATSVGVIPNIIIHEETGFILENNSPQCIAENIIRALENSNLGKIAVNAEKIIEGEFTLDSSVKQWKRIFEKM
jgi:glycosyltransferase involved in cell wall biosynthesis